MEGTTMTLNRKLVGAAAFSLALAGGGAAGAVLGTPNISGAQDDTDTSATTTDSTTDAGTDLAAGRHGPGGHFGGGESLATAAEVLGISEDELRTQLEDGQSIAQVAEAQGVDVQDVVDALVAQATERLDEVEAALPERMTDLVNREGLGDGPGFGPGGHHGFGLGAGLETAAEALGMSEDDLRTALDDGSTLADVAEAQGVAVDDLVAALVTEAEAHIDEAVADEKIDADRAEQLKADLTERITQHVNEGRPEGGPGGFRGGPFG
jgi:polyhydroxyalkanoate synthesis regulator phasin